MPRPAPLRRALVPVLYTALAIALKASALVPVSGIGPGWLKEWIFNAGLALLLAAPLLPLPRRPRLALAWALNALVSLVLLADALYWRFFEDIASCALLRQVDQLGAVSASILDLLRPGDLLWGADLLLAAVVFVLLRLRRPAGPAARRGAEPRRPRWIAAGAMGLAGLLLSGHVVADRVENYGAGLFRFVWSNSRFVQLNGPLAFHINDLRRYVGEELFARRAPTEAERALVRRLYLAREDARKTSATYPLFGAARGANVLNIQLESLQQAFVGMRVQGQEITPTLNRLLRETLHFTRAHHQVGHGRTADATMAALCGLLPLRDTPAFYRRPGFPQRCLPEILRDELHMHTVAYHGDVANFWNCAVVYPHIGFEDFLSRERLGPGEVIGLGLSDRAMLRGALDDLRRRPRPLMAHIVTLTSHHPFALPSAERTLRLGPWEGTGVGDYMQAIHYTDRMLGELIEGLERLGLWETSLVVIYGDHDMGRVRGQERLDALVPGAHGDPIARWIFRRRVPLLIRLPYGRHARRYERVVGQIDIAPTVLHLLGLSPMRRDLLGRSALDPRPRIVAQPDGSGTDGRLLYLGEGVGRAGRCVDLQARRPAGGARCRSLAAAVREELRVSELVLRFGLHGVAARALGGGRSRRRPAP